jgi:hypothetical protein
LCRFVRNGVTREFNGVGWMVGVESGEDSTASSLSNVLVDVIKGGGMIMNFHRMVFKKLGLAQISLRLHL